MRISDWSSDVCSSDLDADQRILATADGDQRLRRQTQRRCRCGRRGGGRKIDMAAQVQTVSVGEPTQPVLVNRAQQLGGFCLDGRVLEGPPRRRGALVIADAGALVQTPPSPMPPPPAVARPPQ